MANDRKVAFVTGAASGIGRATARRFAQEGYAVAVVDVSEEGGRETLAQIHAAGGEATFIHCNIADAESVKEAIADAVAAYGRIDAAFNAAGIDGEPGKLTGECSDANWDRMLAINLTGLWYCMREQIAQMLAQKGGTIVNCASTAGIRGAAFCGAYSASKHGVVGLTRTAALEYASRNIRINAVCPGMIDTPMTRKEGMSDLIAGLVGQSPTGRIGQPEEVAATVAWLSGPDSTFVHGQAIPVDGALTSR